MLSAPTAFLRAPVAPTTLSGSALLGERAPVAGSAGGDRFASVCGRFVSVFAGSVAVSASGRRRSQGRPRLVSLAVAYSELAEAQAAAEAAQLSLEAAKLRAEAMELERARELDRCTARARKLLGEGSQGLTAVRLMTVLKEAENLELTLSQASSLVESVKPGQADAALGLEELQSKTFDEAFQSMQTVIRQDERQKQREEDQKLQEELKKRQEAAPTYTVAADENDDRSIGVRGLAVIAYLLPMVDALRYGLPLLQTLPVLTPLFVLLAIPATIINSIPFGTFIIFILLSFLSNKRDLPRLIRFNMQQAVLIDIAMFLPSLIISLFSMGGNAGFGDEVSGFVFLLVVGCVAYSAFQTLLGNDPEGLPFISDAARRSIDRQQW